MCIRGLYLWVVLCGLCFSEYSCTESKIDRLRLEILARRLEALENWKSDINDNIRVLQALVDAQKNHVYIVSVMETSEGYTILLSDQRILLIRRGERGENGEEGSVVMPVIAVRDSTDGHVYWTMNGSLLLDPYGNAVRADGEQGGQGSSGIQGDAGTVPQVRINPDTDEWEISVDEGNTWTSTGVKATGPVEDKGDTGIVGPVGPDGPAGVQGDAIFVKDGIDIGNDYVEFALTDGTTFRLPFYQRSGGKIQFPEGTKVEMPVGTVRRVAFTLSGGGRNPLVDAVGDNGWLAEVEMDDVRAERGRIVIHAPAKAGRGLILVFLSDGFGSCWTYRLEATALSDGI